MPDCFDTVTSALDPSLGIPVVCLVDDADVVREALAERALLPVLPVIFITGHGDVHTAVAAVKRRAYDFVEKPFSNHAPVDRVELTERECEVLGRVVSGRADQLIADDLGISVRTLEVHRAQIFEKMNVGSAVELAKPLRLAGGRDAG